MKQVIFFPLFTIFSLLICNLSIGQTKYIIYIKTINSEKEIKAIYDSLRVPLLVINNSIYKINSDCIGASFGGIKPRQTGGGTETDYSKPRQTGGGTEMDNSKPRQTGGGTETDNSKPRQTGGGTETDNSKPRQTGGGAEGEFYCEVTSNSELILYLKKIDKHDVVKVFFNDNFIDRRYFKIKKI